LPVELAIGAEQLLVRRRLLAPAKGRTLRERPPMLRSRPQAHCQAHCIPDEQKQRRGD